MRILKCLFCGERLGGESRDDLSAALHAHAAAAHPEDAQLRERIPSMVDAAFGGEGWDGLLRQLPADLEMRPLTPDLEPDFLAFFEGEAFADNPAWAECYCLFYQYAGPDWGAATAAQNRTEKSRLIRNRDAHGILAFAGGMPVGWCHVAPRTSLPAFAEMPGAATELVASIVCFVVPPMYRRQGLARRLLDAAIDHARELGLTTVEAYPARHAASDARAYHGPLRLFLDAGFVETGERGPDIVVRKAI
jgi:GNAT superfamily N-acetyltransferase